MKLFNLGIVLLFSLAFLACSQQAALGENANKSAILEVLAKSQRAWNEGDIEKYMQCYFKSDSVRFAGNGGVTYGWQTLLERYKKKYPDSEAMGKLTFSDVDVTIISSEAALVFGHWKLQKEAEEPSGLYTLLFRKTGEGWKIVHDHTSSAQD